MWFLKMNKKGVAGDILEFKISLLILGIMFFIALLLLGTKYFEGSGETVLVESRVLELQEKQLNQKLLIDLVKKDNLGDLIAAGKKDNPENLAVIHPNDFSSKDSVKAYYDLYLENIDFTKKSKDKVIIDLGNELSHTIIPTFDGNYIIGVVLKDEQKS